MIPSFRKATPADIPAMFAVRRDSILGLAPNGMSTAQSVAWASRLTLDEFSKRIVSTEFWVAEVDRVVIGWVGIRDGEICGLYIDPQVANRGIGSALLRLAEGSMLVAGVATIRLDASWNSEVFYLRQGYIPEGPRPHDDARTFSKSLSRVTGLVPCPRPTIVMLAGLPGTGKTTVAYELARVLRWVVLDKDLVHTTLLNSSMSQDAAGPLAYTLLLDLASDLVATQQRSVILDTAGRQPIILERATQIAEEADASLRVIRLFAPHAIRLERMKTREARASQWTEDATSDTEEAAWYAHLPADTLTVSSAGPVAELLATLLRFVLPLQHSGN